MVTEDANGEKGAKGAAKDQASTKSETDARPYRWLDDPEHPMEGMAQCMSQFSKTFEASARRWELVVYPSLLAFIILAAYGFFLIYKLTNDVDRISNQFERIATSMVNVSKQMGKVSASMSSVNQSMIVITREVSSQNEVMQAMLISMDHMNQSMDTMSMTMYQMRHDTASMGHNFQNATGPMRFMNNFMPW